MGRLGNWRAVMWPVWSSDNVFPAIALGLIAAKMGAELWLARLNQKSVLAHAEEVPDAFKGFIDSQTYAKSVQYTLAKLRLDRVEMVYQTAILVLALFSGVLPTAYDFFRSALGDSGWTMGLFLFTVGIAIGMTGLPLDWYAQFRLEQRFGFNTTTQRLWWIDRLKGLVLSFVLGYPLLVLILKLVDWTGPWWWLWAWSAIIMFQVALAVLVPVLILPLFNKLSPLPEGPLQERLLALARRTGFRTRGIQVMDGSKRSRHSNAFFAGFGRLRKIVLFDTLIDQLSEPELEAVLAHEIGHYRRKHIHKMLAWSAIVSLAGLYALAWLAAQPWFYEGFGFKAGTLVPALLLFGLLSGTVTFWVSPVAHFWSRRYEYQADAFASWALGAPDALITALRKLNEKNLSNLTPHPFYSGFYYSHPILQERERALKAAPAA